MRYFVQLSYLGTNYCGWQIQPNGNTVQQVLNNAFSTILQESIEITGAGRTDTGVHASYFMAHFDSLKENLHLDQKILLKLNGILPLDIAIQKIFAVKSDAHTRFNATSRTYNYFIHQQKDPFLLKTSWYFPYKLDINMMNEASEMMIHFSDFTSFSKLHTDVKTNNCKVFSAMWTQENYKICFTIKADRFLRNMVRAIVGTILEVGKGKIDLEEFVQIVESKNRSEAGISVPAHGLFLSAIEYHKDIFLK
ncbi:MAG: tRNA pseudouridine(38-40) synthase TruA [Bacteroidetes bacterium GWF2_33_16]|nr:MAG: tRNA pseudouridine(38-40) synthase TruA [Bacteroidetes bacterium GWE2_32_14]OFY06987.1 MAG: tRNA pseudouridine(38-40) synthase TruA [Bacteroidetes bacterium GWF2_33_16]